MNQYLHGSPPSWRNSANAVQEISFWVVGEKVLFGKLVLSNSVVH